MYQALFSVLRMQQWTHRHTLPSQRLNSSGEHDLHNLSYLLSRHICLVLFWSFLLLLTVLPWTHCSPLCSCTGVSPGQWIPMLRAYENHLGSFENHQCSDPTSRGSVWVGPENWGFLQTPHDFNRQSALRYMSPSTDCFHASIPSAPTKFP